MCENGILLIFNILLIYSSDKLQYAYGLLKLKMVEIKCLVTFFNYIKKQKFYILLFVTIKVF